MRISRIIALILVAVLCAAGLFAVFTLHEDSGTASTSAGVYINEVMTSNKGAVADENGNYPDWVEIHNSTNEAVDITGFGLTDDKLTAAKWAFPKGSIIEAGGYLVVFCSGNAEDGPYHAGFKLSATDDLIFSNVAGKPIDGISMSSVASGASLGRNENGVWGELSEPSPGYPNTAEGAAAYRESRKQETADAGVYINEFMASNATTLPGTDGSYPDWVELYNTTSAAVDLSGFGLSDDENQPVKWQMPEGTVIEANGYLIIYCSGRDGWIDGALNAPFGLRSYAESVVLANAKGQVLDSYTYTAQETDRSMARVPDGTGEFVMTAAPTPGYPNTDAGAAQFAQTGIFPAGDIVISELMSSNETLLQMDDGSYPDWIELYNNGSDTVDLTGWALSNNPKNPAKWLFPAGTTIAPGEYLTVLATGSGKSNGEQKKNPETNFVISAAGEVLVLFNASGQPVDKLQAGNLTGGISYGRSGSALCYYETPTPGEKNGQGAPGRTQSPQFSVAPGVYGEAVTVELTVPEGETVHYTTDCTTPTASSPAYSGSITISENTVLRAVSVRSGYLTGYTVTGTYLFTTDGVNHALPVATLVTDPDNLWDGKSGIYAYGDQYDDSGNYSDSLLTANFYQGKNSETEQAKWEREANFAVFADDTNTLAFSQNVGIRIAGAFGRGRAQKGFNIIARDSFGPDRMRYAFFENRPYTEYKALVLRAGGQDQNYSKIRDELSTGLLEDTSVRILYQAYKPYVLYLNGEYWGVYFLKEKRNRFFVAQHEGLAQASQLDLLKSETRASYGSLDEWKELMAFVRGNDLSSQSNYDYLAQRLDIGSFIDYMITEIYVSNTDTWNMQFYKTDGGKWKFIYYDFCWGWHQSPTHETVTYRRKSDKPLSDLFNGLLKNKGFRDEFCRRFAQLLDEVYAPERVLALIDELYAAVEPEIERERAKFNGETFMGKKQYAEVLGSYNSFQKHIENTRAYAKERPKGILANLKSELGLSDSYMQEVFGKWL